jgi:pimeloyl-ACP methyl ester carboxylesterase
VVLLHGLTATNRYVVMGSKNLERSGHDVIAYDARGHGESDPGDAYTYAELAGDLAGVMDAAGVERAVMAGASMGAHTALSLALSSPERVAGLVIATPGFDPEGYDDPASLARWDALSEGLRTGGVDGFVEAYGPPTAAQQWNETLATVLRQRMEAHAHPEAVADALQQIPRSKPFNALTDLEAINCPVRVVGSRDEPDPGHPLQTAKAYASALRTELILEEPGKSPIAWQGGQLSKVIAEVAREAKPAL